jgi:hypothetical protein
MAHFAKLDENNIVINVEVVTNSVIIDENDNEVEQLGVDFLNELYGTTDVYKQTSYNGNLRKNYAGMGYVYDEARDAFISPQPYPSWVLNEATCQYEAPIELPSDASRNGGDAKYQWNEDTQAWDAFVE